MEKKENENKDISEEILNNINNGSFEIIDPNASENKRHPKRNKWILISGFLIIIIAAGIFFYPKFQNKSKEASTGTSTSNQSQAVVPPQDDNALTENYTGDKIPVDFKYPQDWKVVEDGGYIKVMSPKQTVTDVKGNSIPASFTLFIKQGADKNDSSYLGNGYATNNSESIKYTDPAPGQRPETYNTNFGLNKSDNFTFFIVQGNFNLKKDDTLGPNYASEPDSILILGGYDKGDKSGNSSLISLSLESYQTDKNYQAAVSIVKTIKLK